MGVGECACVEGGGRREVCLAHALTLTATQLRRQNSESSARSGRGEKEGKVSIKDDKKVRAVRLGGSRLGLLASTASTTPSSRLREWN